MNFNITLLVLCLLTSLSHLFHSDSEEPCIQAFYSYFTLFFLGSCIKHWLCMIMPKIDLDERTIPPEVLDELCVTREDFLSALKRIQPSAMREVMVQMPNVGWEDIGGVGDAIDKLKEGIELPLKNADAFHRLGIRPAKGFLLHGPDGKSITSVAESNISLHWSHVVGGVSGNSHTGLCSGSIYLQKTRVWQSILTLYWASDRILALLFASNVYSLNVSHGM